jgi:Protein of unknown function (DUF2799)
MHTLKLEWTRRTASAVAMLLVAACATTEPTIATKIQCAGADWALIGFADGAAGRNAGYIAVHRDNCGAHNIVPDLATYEKGYIKGVMAYCTKERGYEEGGKNRVYQNTCPDELEGTFMEGYTEGLAAYRSQKEFRRTQMREHALGGAETIPRQ